LFALACKLAEQTIYLFFKKEKKKKSRLTKQIRTKLKIVLVLIKESTFSKQQMKVKLA
jgi:hypothetical protein